MEPIRRFVAERRPLRGDRGRRSRTWLEAMLARPASRWKGSRTVFRFGELNVDRVRRILAGDASPEPVPPRGKPPELCHGCPHRSVFAALRDLDCIVAGDIGCYTLGGAAAVRGD